MTQVVWADEHCESLVTGSMEVRVPISPASAEIGKVRLGTYVVETLSRMSTARLTSQSSVSPDGSMHACR